MPQTSQDVANQAIQLIGDNQPAVTGQAPTFDNSTAGKALQQIYAPTVAAVQREHGWDASRRIAALQASGNAAPYPFGYTGEYLYPSNGIEIWDVQPRVPADVNDPLPTQYTVGNTLVAGVQTKVIWTSVAAPYATYNNSPAESTWDSLFTEAVVRALASKLSVALAGKAETAAMMGQTAQMAVKINQDRNG
jgi:hypothetical protein